MFFVKLFYMIFLIGSGVLILKYRRTVKSWTGNFVWAEQYLGRGGTYGVIIVFAIWLIFVGLLMPFWWLEFIFGTSWNLSDARIRLK